MPVASQRPSLAARKGRPQSTSLRCAWIGAAILTVSFAIASPMAICAIFATPVFFVFIWAVVAVVGWTLRRIAPNAPFRPIALTLTVVLALGLGARFIYESTPKYMFREMIADPIPASVRDLTAEEAPSFSDGSAFYFRFAVASNDVDALKRKHGLAEDPVDLDDQFEDRDYEHLLRGWPPYHRPAHRRVLTGPKLVIVYDTARGIAYATVDQMTDPVTRR